MAAVWQPDKCGPPLVGKCALRPVGRGLVRPPASGKVADRPGQFVGRRFGRFSPGLVAPSPGVSDLPPRRPRTACALWRTEPPAQLLRAASVTAILHACPTGPLLASRGRTSYNLH